MIAMALANEPDVLIADEPTTALDVTVQARILELLAELKQRLGMAVVFISHDLNIVRRIADRVCVMRHGEIVEAGRTADIFAATAASLHAHADRGRATRPQDAARRRCARRARRRRRARHVQDCRRSCSRRSRRTSRPSTASRSPFDAARPIGVVGECGSGKSTLGRAVLKLVPASGLVRFEDRNLAPLDRDGMRPLRRHMQVVFQDPFGSLSPRMTAGEIVTEGLLVHERSILRAERDRRAAQAFEEVQLDPATRHRFPHEFSGGQRQRIAIARAMVLKPKLVVLDEPTSALDRSVQKEIVELLRDLQSENGLAYVFISHDLAVVRALSDRILVMRNGQVVEQGDAEQIVSAPRETYTQELMRAAFGNIAPVAAGR